MDVGCGMKAFDSVSVKVFLHLGKRQEVRDADSSVAIKHRWCGIAVERVRCHFLNTMAAVSSAIDGTLP